MDRKMVGNGTIFCETDKNMVFGTILSEDETAALSFEVHIQ